MAAALTVEALEQRGAVLVEENLTHQIWEFPDKAKNGWRSFYVRLIDQPKDRWTKRAWWLGHNGNRLSQGPAAKQLRESDPETYSWVDSELWAWIATDGGGFPAARETWK